MIYRVKDKNFFTHKNFKHTRRHWGYLYLQKLQEIFVPSEVIQLDWS